MRILIYGAGVIGSLFAGKLAEKAFDVSILARGERYDEIKKDGIVLFNRITNSRTQAEVKVIDKLDQSDFYDFILLTVQATQVDSILPALANNVSQNIVFCVNNPIGYEKWINVIGAERIILGFPSAGGEREKGIVNYHITQGFVRLFQATTFGELNGKKTKRLKELVQIFRSSGFSPRTNKNMDSWQKYHVAVILPIGRALNRFESNNYKLADSKDTLKAMILATRECFLVLKTLKYKITPKILYYYYLPCMLLVLSNEKIMKSKLAEFAYARHNRIGRNEMEFLENQFNSLILKDKVNMRYFNTL